MFPVNIYWVDLFVEINWRMYWRLHFGFGFIASFFGLLIIVPGLALFIVGAIRKFKLMHRRFSGGEKFIQNYLDVPFLLIGISTMAIIAWVMYKIFPILIIVIASSL